MLHILKVIGICLEVLLVFNLMIIVHELGHFLAARWRGLVVEEFGLWFGKPLWKKTINGVVYSWGSLPFGGFVKLPQLAPMEMMEGKTELTREQLPPISVMDKIIVAFAGPLFSFLLAALFAVIVWQVGRPVGEAEATTVVGAVVEGSPAAEAGLQVGDKILEVDGQPVARFAGMGSDSITWRVVRSEGATIPLKVEREGQILSLEATPRIPPTKWWQRSGLRQIMIGPAETPMVAEVPPESAAARAGLQANDLVTAVNGQRVFGESTLIEYAAAHPGEALTLTVQRGEQTLQVPFQLNGARIGAVMKDSPAEVAGLKPGDRVLEVDGQPQRSLLGVSAYVQKQTGRPIALTIERRAPVPAPGFFQRLPFMKKAAPPEGPAERLQVKVTPVPPVGEQTPRLGLEWAQDDSILWDREGRRVLVHPPPVEQLYKSARMIWDTLGAVFSSKSSIGMQHMGGPVMMMRAYYNMFESEEGWRLALWFSVVLNVNLALLNLLPIPVLDGGHITLAIVEGVRRRPVNVRILEFVQTACALLLIGFMVFIMFFDVQDWLGGDRGPRMKFDRTAVTEAQKG